MSTELHYIAGGSAADRLLLDLVTLVPAGDDLHHIIDQHTEQRGAEHDAFLRGFCRRLQKELETRA